MKCDAKFDENAKQSWALKPTPDAPKSVTALKKWLSDRTPGGHFHGKVYVASTIKFTAEHGSFAQWGCSPNFDGGLWSLACCKHAMRSSKKFKAWISARKNEPVFIFTLAAKNGEHQALVSVAQVTGHFSNMKEYAAWLLKQGKKIQSSRLTREFKREGIGVIFGDCHADYKGEVGSPSKGHKHYGKASKDLNGNHVILISRVFLVWDRPALIWNGILKQLGYGMDLNNGNFAGHFKRI